MKRVSFEDMNCSVAQSLEIVGEWWTLLIVRDGLFGVTRFDDFQNRLGISRNVLNQRLVALVDHGVMRKVAYQERPERFDYKLTEKGRDLWIVLEAIRNWGDKWAAPNGPPIELVHRGGCGERMHTVPSCSACGEAVGVRDLRVVAGPGTTDDSLIPNRQPA